VATGSLNKEETITTPAVVLVMLIGVATAVFDDDGDGDDADDMALMLVMMLDSHHQTPSSFLINYWILPDRYGVMVVLLPCEYKEAGGKETSI